MIIGTGIDMVELERIKRLREERPRLIRRILTDDEWEQYAGLSAFRQVEYLAGRFAAKEALAKALGCGVGRRFTWHHVSILNQPGGAPSVHWHRSLTDGAAGQLNIHLSISHTRQYAIAQVILEH
ncbi:holo-[acyl-carrier protein] synthase [Caldalkalibacillus uzonensis]|uniref:Holo-[acyl-carrier-protein] synthase n=1 Tax=Caldalkalibacillus uzonensis TaxID=353224 RepID=A0ABU0CVM2_9BACI|nr:holo-ACP synthase [Caldalkalibacillus uzonensis]MDQ0340462.1 holo-[acyl-carrier protein] synthase [Caldalkalibacillus uzonensis]